MPKTIYLPDTAEYSGISVEWTPTTGMISISGWYDSCVGIQGESMPIAELFERLGIEEKHIKKALTANKRKATITAAESLCNKATGEKKE